MSFGLERRSDARPREVRVPGGAPLEVSLTGDQLICVVPDESRLLFAWLPRLGAERFSVHRVAAVLPAGDDQAQFRLTHNGIG